MQNDTHYNTTSIVGIHDVSEGCRLGTDGGPSGCFPARPWFVELPSGMRHHYETREQAEASQHWPAPPWVLIHEDEGYEVRVGDTVYDFRENEPHTLISIHPPHKPSSSGAVMVRYPGSEHNDRYYPSVFGLKIVRGNDALVPSSDDESRPEHR